MHTVGKYSRDKEHKARILADNLDKQDAGDKVDTPAFEVGTPAADRVSKRGETAAPRSGERAAHPSHVRGARTAHCQHFVPLPGHYLPPQFDCCQRVAFRECWIAQGVVEYPPGLFPRVPIAPRLAADQAPQSLAPGRYIQNSLCLRFLPIQVSLLASLSMSIRYYCMNAGNYQSFRIQVGSSNLRFAPRSYPYQALLLAWRAAPESST